MFKLFSEYLFPENPIALGIVIFLICCFCIWVVGLIVYWIWLINKRKQIENNQNIQSLVDALQERDLGREDSDPNINAEEVFRLFCEKQELGKSSLLTKHIRKIFPLRKDSSIAKHIKTVFLAGWDESRLEVSELINHTSNNLFRWNGLFRSVLAVFIVIGLLGTLFGLTDSLTDLSPALKESAAIETPTENSERMTQALGNLMDNIKGAFAPSIWGIFFTVLGVILYGIYLQFACHPVKSILERLTLTVWVPQLYPTTSQKFIQTIQKSESQMQKGFETAAQFSESVKKVHGNIDEFNESLTQVRAITQPLSDSVTQINKAASDISNAADVLNTGFTESLDRFSKDFESSVNNLTGFQDEIRNLHQQFQDAANQKLNQFQDASNQKLEQQTQKLDEQNQNLITSLEVFKNNERLYVDSCQQIDETLQQFLNKTNEANANIETSNREFLDGINTSNREWISEIQDQLKSELAIIQPTLKKELESLTNQLTSDLNEVQGTLDERLKALTDQLNFFQLPIEKTADQIEGTIESFTKIMKGIVNDLQSEFQKQNETITEQNEKYGEQLTNVKNLNERVENLLTQLDESSKNQKEAVDTLSSNVGGLTDNINNLDSAINNFTSDSGDLSQSVGAIRGDIEKLGTASQQFVEKVDKADVTPLTASIEKLNTSINAISQHSHSLADAVDRLARQEGSLGSGQKTKRPFFKIILNPLSWRWPFKKNTSETKNKNEEK